MPKISRRQFNRRLATGVLGSSLVGSAPLAQLARRLTRETQPNFVFVCSDQHSAKYAGFAGHPLVKTPNLDRIARNGVAFTSAYCGSPLCVPGRSSMMTGMYPSDVNSFCNSTVYDGSHPTWGKRLRDAGYYCWAVGKQDLNPACDLGFVESSVEHGHSKKPDITSLFRRPVGYRIGEREGIDGAIRDTADTGGKPKPTRDELDTRLGLDFIRTGTANLRKPWAAFIGLREPHPEWAGLKEYFDYYLPRVEPPPVTFDELERLPLPYQVMRNFKRISTPIPEERVRRAIAAYFSMVSELDTHVGEIYKALEETDRLRDTFFIYTSDHGESLGEHGMWLKNNLYEGDTRVPLLVSGPGVPKGKIIDTPVAHVDLVATMLQWAGLKVPGEIRGTSLIPLTEGKPGSGPRLVYVESHSEGNPTGSCMVRHGDWKLMHFSYYQDCLFNLKDDPEEKHDLSSEPSVQDVMKELQSMLRGLVDPEEITERAFTAQNKVLNEFVVKLNEEGLFTLFRSRMGEGQARIIAKMLKGKNS